LSAVHRDLRLSSPLLLAGTAAGVIAVFAAVLFPPSFLNFDAMYSLLWGADIASGRLPDFTTDGAPTPHPLSNAVGALLAPLGDHAAIALMALTYLALGVTVVATFIIGRAVFHPVAGAIAAVLVGTRGVLLYHTALAYLDIAFTALVLAAVAVEITRPRRGPSVAIILAFAGLLRPEAWPLAWAYAAYRWRDESRAGRLVLAGSAIAGPALWALADLIVTGDPVFSFTYTRDRAAELGRKTGLADLISEGPRTLGGALGIATTAAAVLGAVIAWQRGGQARRLLVFLAVILVAVWLPPLAGTPIRSRYFLPVVALLAVLAAAGIVVPLAGAKARGRRVAVSLLALAVLVTTVLDVGDLRASRRDLAEAREIQESLRELVEPPGRLGCAPVAVARRTVIPQVSFWGDVPYRSIRSEPDVRSGTIVTAVGDAKRRYLPGAPPGPPSNFGLFARSGEWQLWRRGC
jgi:hypothetical protein